MVNAFEQGIMAGPFSDSLIRNSKETFSEIQRRVVAHISAEEVVATKHDNSFSRHPKPKESDRVQPQRVNETSTEKRADLRYAPYVAKRDEPNSKSRDESTFQPKFRVSYKELLGM